MSTDSQEALCSDSVEKSEGLLNLASVDSAVVEQPQPGVSEPSEDQDLDQELNQDLVDQQKVDQEVSLLTCSSERSHPGLKRFHSVDTRGRGRPRPRPLSWLDEPRRHSVEAVSSVESSPQGSSASSGFVSRGDSLQTQTPRRKKKMSPPCISVEPPDFPNALLPAHDSCLRRRAPSSDSKDSFDLTAGENSGPERGSPKNKLLTLPNFSCEKSSSADH